MNVKKFSKIFCNSLALFLLLNVNITNALEKNIQLGDANSDGVIDNNDAQLVLKYAADNSIEINKEAADVNQDGKIDSFDASLILRYVSGYDIEFGNVSSESECLLGDVNADKKVNNEDVELLNKYLASEEVLIDLVAADMNKDDKVNILDLSILRNLLADQSKNQQNIKLGDVNSDGVIDNNDAQLVLKYVADNSVEINKEAADVNQDGKIDSFDVALILRYVSGYDVEFGNVSSESECLLGDVNADKKINNEDVELLNKYLAGEEVLIDLVAADMNKDGKLDILDLSMLRQLLTNNFFIEDHDSGIKIQLNDNEENNLNLKVTTLEKNKIPSKIVEMSAKYIAYDISLKNPNGIDVQPNSKVKVSIPIPVDFDKTKLLVYRIEDDGTLTKFNVIVNGENAEFEVDHFSNYVLIETNVKNPQTLDSNNNLFIIISIICCGFILVKILRLNNVLKSK